MTEAVGTFNSGDKSASYSLKMEYDEVYNVTRKKLSLEQNNLQFKGTLKTGHDFSYKYDSLNTFKLACVDSREYRSDSAMVDTVSVKYAYEFDANGNQIKGGVRQMLWDEENRLLAVSEGGFISNYFYDCNGDRTVKLSSGREEVYVNAQQAYKDDSLPQKFVAYVSPYMVVKNGGQYTKHIYAGNQRIASKLGNIDDFGADPRRVDYAGADLKEMDFSKRYKLNNDELSARYDSLEIDCKFRVIDDYVNNQSFCCDNAGNEILADLGEESATSSESVVFYYHPDHLGSTAIVSDVDGRITQNVVYIPFGEVFVEQRDGNWNTPYLFNAKELDEETGLYYYGARYLEPTSAQWLSVDPLFEKYAGMSPYNYCAGNPVKLVDVDGRALDGSDAETIDHAKLIEQSILSAYNEVSNEINSLNNKTDLSKEEKAHLKDLNLRKKSLSQSHTRLKKIVNDKKHMFRIRTTDKHVADLKPSLEDLEKGIITLTYVKGDMGNAIHEVVVHGSQIVYGRTWFQIKGANVVRYIGTKENEYDLEVEAYKAQYSYKGVYTGYEDPAPDCNKCNYGNVDKQINDDLIVTSYNQINKSLIKRMQPYKIGDKKIYKK